MPSGAAFDNPADDGLIAESEELERHRARIQQRATVLARAITAASAGVGRQTRRWLTTVAHSCESGTAPVPDPPGAVAEELSIQAPRLAAMLAVDAADRVGLADRVHRFSRRSAGAA